MAAGNEFFVVGNLTRDPELGFTNSGRQFAKFGIAYNKRWRNAQSGEWEEETHFFDVVAWGDLAENTAESLNKGDRVMISGWVQQQTWEDRETGQNRSKHEIVADEIGPSLRWATATATKVQRGEGNGGQSRGGNNRGGDRGGNRGGNGGGGRQSAPQRQEPDYSEEPF